MTKIREKNPYSLSEDALGTCLVTGAAGTVGAFVVRHLLDRGAKVIAVDRPGTNYPKVPKGDNFSVRSGDLSDPAFCEDAVEGAECVVHTAALNDSSLAHDTLSPINVDASKNLYEAARRAQVRHFVFFSSGGLYDFSKLKKEKRGFFPKKAFSKPVACREECDFATPWTDFQKTKLEAEKLLRELAGSPGPTLTVLRPALIYGPAGQGTGLTGNLAGLPPVFYLLTGGRMVRFIGGPKMSWVHAEDAARAAVFVLEHEEAWGDTFNLADESPLSLGQVATAAMEAYGVPLEMVVPLFPKWVFRWMRPLLDNDALYKLLDYLIWPLWSLIRLRHRCSEDLRPHFTKGLVSYLFQDSVLSNEKLCSLGFHYKWPDFRAGYPKVLDWYMKNRWTPTRKQLEETRDVEVSFRLGWRGTHTYSKKPGGPLESSLDLHLTLPKLLDPTLKRDLLARGSILLKSLADNVACHGSLEVRPWERRFLLYLTFQDNENRPMHLQASTQLKLGRGLYHLLSHMNAVIFDEGGREVSRVQLKAKFSTELVKLVTSMRLKY